MVKIQCAYPDCEFSTDDVNEALACALLQNHAYVHALIPQVQTARQPPAHERRRPNLDQPKIDIGVSLEEWNIFERRWQVFKQGSDIYDASVSQLRPSFSNVRA